MFDPNNDSGRAIVVAVGLLAGHLFLYGRKLKSNIKISTREILGDAMQFITMFVGAMGFQSLLKAFGWGPKDVWQTVTITIIFCMSFDTYLQKFRQIMDSRMGAIISAIFGKMPSNVIVGVPAGEGLPAKLAYTRTIPEEVVNREFNTDGIDDDDDDISSSIDKLN